MTLQNENICRSSLENYTSNNTRQHEFNTRQHDRTQVQHDRTQVQHEYNTAQHEYNTSTMRQTTSVTRPNTSTKEALAAKIGLFFALFVTELYIFLISYKNS